MPVWSEGLLLTPQHFQQADRSFRHLLAQRFRAASNFDWGLTRLVIDGDAVRNGRIVVTQAAGVLPDGTPFSLPDDDPLPPERAIDGHFDARQDMITVRLGLPSESASRALLGDAPAPGGAGARYVADTAELPDANTGQNARPLEVQRRHFRVLFPDESVGEHDSLPIAEVTRTSEGGYALRDTFIPPSLALGASDALVRLLQNVREMLIGKSTNLGDMRRQRGGAADFASSDAVNFWMLHSVNAFVPALSHALSHRRAHPEEVYLILVSLAGELCTLSADQHPRDLPVYQHDDLAATFSALQAIIPKLLVIESMRASRIELQHKGAGMYVGHLNDPRLVEPGMGLYLGVRADLEEQRMAVDLPGKVKIASIDKIDFLIANALRGVPLRYQRVAPASLPIKGSYLYFQLDPVGDAWETVRAAKNIAVYVPPDVPSPSVELLGLKE
jgi:type VI secretion system protein ImpJ